MPYKDPEKRRAYHREYSRMRRAGQPPGSRGVQVVLPTTQQQTETAQGLLGVLSKLINDVLQTKEGDIFIRSRTAGYLISIGLKAVEVASLEARITALEEKAGGGK